MHRPGSVWLRMDGNTLVAHPDVSDRCRLHGVGTLLWNRLEAPCSRTDLIDAVLGDYAVAREQARTDVIRFTDSMLERGWLTEADTSR